MSWCSQMSEDTVEEVEETFDCVGWSLEDDDTISRGMASLQV